MKKSGRLYDNNFPGGAGQDLLGGFASWWREAGRCSRRQMRKGCRIFHHQHHFIFLIVVLFVAIVLLLLFLFLLSSLQFLLLETNWKTIRAPFPPLPRPNHHHRDDFHLLKIFTGSNQVGLWDCLDTESETHGVHLFHYHSRYGANRNMYISSFTATLCGPKKSISQLSCVFPGQ